MERIFKSTKTLGVMVAIAFFATTAFAENRSPQPQSQDSVSKAVSQRLVSLVRSGVRMDGKDSYLAKEAAGGGEVTITNTVESRAWIIELTDEDGNFAELTLTRETGELPWSFSAMMYNGEEITAPTQSDETVLIGLGNFPVYKKAGLAHAMLLGEVVSQSDQAEREVAETDISDAMVPGSISGTVAGVTILLSADGQPVISIFNARLAEIGFITTLDGFEGGVATVNADSAHTLACKRLLDICLNSKDDQAAAIACTSVVEHCPNFIPQ